MLFFTKHWLPTWTKSHKWMNYSKFNVLKAMRIFTSHDDSASLESMEVWRQLVSSCSPSEQCLAQSVQK